MTSGSESDEDFTSEGISLGGLLRDSRRLLDNEVGDLVPGTAGRCRGDVLMEEVGEGERTANKVGEEGNEGRGDRVVGEGEGELSKSSEENKGDRPTTSSTR